MNLSPHRRLILSCAGIVCASIFGFSGNSYAADCTNTYSKDTAVPAGYGAAHDFFSTTKDLFLKGSDCETSSFKITAGTTATQYAYKTGYSWNGTTWTAFSLTGQEAGSDWRTGPATATINTSPQSGTFVVAYICQQVNNAWKCGCRDEACATPMWQLQGVRRSDDAGLGTPLPATDVQPPPQASGMRLLWQDEFNSLNLYHPTNNPNGLWRFGDFWQNPLMDGYYDFAYARGFNINPISTNPAITPFNPLSVEGGVLKIKGQRALLSDSSRAALRERVNTIGTTQQSQRTDQATWFGSWITAFNSQNDTAHSFRYGYVEARVKFPNSKGQGASFWLYEAGDQSRREIDIIEVMGFKDRWFFNIHPTDPTPNTPFIEDIYNNFHTYGLLWTPTELKVYYDNRLMETVTGENASRYNGNMRVILSLAYEATWFTPAQMTDASDPSPQQMEVDYVRAWQ